MPARREYEARCDIDKSGGRRMPRPTARPRSQRFRICMHNEWVRELNERLRTHPGLVVEDKKYSVTIHYRNVRGQAHVREAIAEAIRDLPNARALGGDQSVNVLLRDGSDKGSALQRARRALGCDTAIYVGNDETDEDAFASDSPDHLVAIRVGPAKVSRARFCVKTQADIDRLLQTLLALRTRRAHG